MHLSSVTLWVKTGQEGPLAGLLKKQTPNLLRLVARVSDTGYIPHTFSNPLSGPPPERVVLTCTLPPLKPSEGPGFTVSAISARGGVRVTDIEAGSNASRVGIKVFSSIFCFAFSSLNRFLIIVQVGDQLLAVNEQSTIDGTPVGVVDSL